VFWGAIFGVLLDCTGSSLSPVMLLFSLFFVFLFLFLFLLFLPLFLLLILFLLSPDFGIL
jgi:hypothetical protein